MDIVWNYIHRKKVLFNELVIEQRHFEKFIEMAINSDEVQLTREELSYYNDLREAEIKEYNRRNFLFWPSWVMGLLLFDSIIVIPVTKTNKVRTVWNIVLGIPFVSIVTTGMIFYKGTLPSHTYAFELCEKYGIELTEEEKDVSDVSNFPDAK